MRGKETVNSKSLGLIMRMPRKGSIDRTDATIRSNDSSCNASLSRGENEEREFERETEQFLPPLLLSNLQ